jgi:hypothetical protein
LFHDSKLIFKDRKNWNDGIMENWKTQIKGFKVERMIQTKLFNPFRVGFLLWKDYYTPILLGVMNILPEGFSLKFSLL